jgi:putative Mg2+ transporter-C (MgtC) family protein
LTILLRLLVALILAGVIGWERETVGKSAGVRTHMFVGLGAALFVALGDLVIRDFRLYGDQVRFDPIRLIEAIVAAVGFLGAGTIFVSRDKDRVKNLTTAASLWVTAAIGIAVGLEHYVLAVGSTALVFLVLRLLLRFEMATIPEPPEGPASAPRLADVAQRDGDGGAPR